MQIGELARFSGLSASRIRFYEAAGLIAVARRPNGYRAYTEDALVALNIITSAQEAGFTLEEIRQLMPAEFPTADDGRLLDALRSKLSDIRAMEKRLAQLRRRLLALIAVVEDRQEGVSCEEHAARILKSLARAG